MQKNKVFLDSSILITAVLSSQGGSFYMLTQLNKQYEFQINEYVLEETMRVLATKFNNQPGLKTNLYLLLGIAAINVLPNPTPKQIKKLMKIINKEDSPILASALEHDSFLVTLDNDFFTKITIEFSQKRSLKILKPQEFIALNRQK